MNPFASPANTSGLVGDPTPARGPPSLQMLQKPCPAVVTRAEALRDPAARVPVAQILQVLVDRARCLHICAEFPRGSMSLNYKLPRGPLPALPPDAPRLQAVAASDCCLVTMVEGMGGPKRAEYLPRLLEMLGECRANGVDFVVYTDAPLPELEPQLQELQGRGLFVRYLQDVRVPAEGRELSLDELIDLSVQRRQDVVAAMPRSKHETARWDVLHGRIDFAKMLLTRDAASGTWPYVAYQDAGKVVSIAHHLKDAQVRQIIDQFGLLQAGGALPENYGWLTGQAVHRSWAHAVEALVEFFLAPPAHGAVRRMDMSHFCTLGAQLVRQHIVYLKCGNAPALDPKPQQVLRLGAIEGLGTPLNGGLLPCNYTFVNSNADLQVAIAIENLSCSHFSNMIMTDLSESTMQRVVTTLHRLSMIHAQEGVAGAAPYVQCAEVVLAQALQIFNAPPLSRSYSGGERMRAKRARQQRDEADFAEPVFRTPVMQVEALAPAFGAPWLRPRSS